MHGILLHIFEPCPQHATFLTQWQVPQRAADLTHCCTLSAGKSLPRDAASEAAPAQQAATAPVPSPSLLKAGDQLQLPDPVTQAAEGTTGPLPASGMGEIVVIGDYACSLASSC